MKISLDFWNMAYRNENGYNRPVNTTASTTTGATVGDNDRTVNWMRYYFSRIFILLLFVAIG